MDSTNLYKIAYYSTVLLDFNNGTSQPIKLAAKLDDEVFCVWIKPQKTIERSLPTREGIGFLGSDIFLHNVKQPTVSMETAVMMFLTFLKKSPKSVLLVTYFRHSTSDPLSEHLQKTGTLQLFNGVIAGFVNILPILRIRYSVVSAMELPTLPNLTFHLLRKEYTQPLYETPYDVEILEELVTKKLSKLDLIRNRRSLNAAILSEDERHLGRTARAELPYSIASGSTNETGSFERERSPVRQLPNYQIPANNVPEHLIQRDQQFMEEWYGLFEP